MPSFSAVNLGFTCFCYTANFSSNFFLAFQLFVSFNAFSIRICCLNTYYRNIFGFEDIKKYKIEKMFFSLPASETYSIKNDPRMQLRSVSHERVNRNSPKSSES